MILKSIKVSRWGAFVEPVAVNGFTEGINLLEAPNEAGKSTLLEALRMAIFDRHTLSGKEISEIIPWGKKLAPWVEVEFTAEGHEYRIVKQFVDPPFSQFYIDGELHAESASADEAILDIVGGTSPGRGLSKTAHLGLAGILWAPQGSIHLTEKPEWDAEVLTEVAAPSSVILGKKEKEIQNQLEAYLAEYLTPTGRNRSSSPINSIKEKIDALDTEINEVFDTTQKLESYSQEVQKDTESQAIIEAEIAELDERLQETREKMDEATEGIQALQKQETEVENLTRESNALREKKERFDSLKNDITSMSKEREELAETISDKKIEIKSIEKRISKIKETMRFLSTQKKEKNIDIEKAGIQEKLRERKKHLKEIEEIINEAEKITAQIEALKKDIDKLNAPEEEAIDEIKTFREQISTLELQLKSSGLKLELKPKKSVKGKIVLDGKEERFQVSSKKPGDWVAARSVEIDMANIGKLNITSGATEQEELEQELTEARILAEKHPLSGLSNVELENLIAKEHSMEEQISNLQAEYRGKMGKNPKTKIKKAAKLKKEVQQLRKKVGKTKEKSNLSKLKGELEKIQNEQEKIQSELDEFSGTHEKLKETMNDLSLKLRETEVRIENSRAEMERIKEDGHTQQQRERELKNLRAKLEKEKKKFESLKEQYGDLPAKLKKEVSSFENAKAKCRKKLDDCKQAVYSKKAEIIHLQEKADHVKLARLKERRSELQTQLKEKEAYIEGLKLLSDRIQAKRGDVAQQVHAPLENRINHLLRSLTGLKYEGITFDEKLIPTSVRVSGIEESEPWSRLSYGLREQVSVLTRLALGEITGGSDKQMVILDDPLVNTDDQRMVEMFHIFEALSEKLQLVIFTCHGRNYRPLNATKLEVVKT